MSKTIQTTWDIRTYDVLGNPRDGYEVNDSYSRGSVNLTIPVTVYNAGTSMEFEGAYPTSAQIKQIFGFSGSIDTDGDDMTIYVNRARDGRPFGEMTCTSHESLSPIRTKKKESA